MSYVTLGATLATLEPVQKGTSAPETKPVAPARIIRRRPSPLRSMETPVEVAPVEVEIPVEVEMPVKEKKHWLWIGAAAVGAFMLLKKKK